MDTTQSGKGRHEFSKMTFQKPVEFSGLPIYKSCIKLLDINN